MSRTGRRRGLGSMLVGLCLLGFLMACGPVARPGPVDLSGDSFLGTDTTSLDVWSATTGRVERVLLPLTDGRLTIHGVALLGRQLYLTYTTGPACSSRVAGCGPVPDTCGARVDRLDLSTGRRQVVWQVSRDTLLRDAEPSPDGTRLAALTSPCVPSFLNQHLVVRTLADGASTTIAAGLPRCHQLSEPRWTGDGRHLIVEYGAATGATAWTGSDGTCTGPEPTGLVELDATAPRAGIDPVQRRSPPAGCAYTSVAARGGDVYAVFDCERTGTASLQRLDDRLALVRQWPLGRCQADSSLAVGPTGTVLIAAYASCTPATELLALNGTTLRRLSSHVGGETVPDQLTG